MLNDVKSTDLFCDYYEKWVRVYKEGAIRKVTLDKYHMTISWLKKLVPTVVRRRIYCKRSSQIRTCKYDNHAENLFAYHTGT